MSSFSSSWRSRRTEGTTTEQNEELPGRTKAPAWRRAGGGGGAGGRHRREGGPSAPVDTRGPGARGGQLGASHKSKGGGAINESRAKKKTATGTGAPGGG